jgi:hypothetical protein
MLFGTFLPPEEFYFKQGIFLPQIELDFPSVLYLLKTRQEFQPQPFPGAKEHRPQKEKKKKKNRRRKCILI